MMNISRCSLRVSGCLLALLPALVSCTRGPETNEARVFDYTVPLIIGKRTIRVIPLFTPNELAGGPSKNEEQQRRMDPGMQRGKDSPVYLGVFPRTETRTIGDFRGSALSLDVAFLGEDGEVVSLQHQPPFSVTRGRVPFTLNSKRPARFVLWAQAGRLAALGVHLGAKLGIAPRLKDVRVAQFRVMHRSEGRFAMNSELFNLQVLDTPALQKHALRDIDVRSPEDDRGENPLVLAVRDNFGRAIVRREDEPMPQMQAIAEGDKTTIELWYVVRVRAKSGKRADDTYRLVKGGLIPPGANPAEVTGLAPAGWRVCIILAEGAGSALGLQGEMTVASENLLALLSRGRVLRDVSIESKAGAAQLHVEVARTEEERLSFPWDRFSIRESEGLLFPLTKKENRAVRVTDFMLPTLRAPASLAFIDENGVVRALHDVEPEPWPLVYLLSNSAFFRIPWTDRWSVQRSSLESKLTHYDSNGVFVRYALLAAPGWFRKHGITTDGSSRMTIDGGLRIPGRDIDSWKPAGKDAAPFSGGVRR